MFEPVLLLLVELGARVPFLFRLGMAMKLTMARGARQVSGTGAGPIGLLLVAFGVDPMTGRAAAMAAGHGFVAGWAFAIAGDMLYYAVIAVTTLRLNAYLGNPTLAMGIVLGGMVLVPVLVRRGRSALGGTP